MAIRRLFWALLLCVAVGRAAFAQDLLSISEKLLGTARSVETSPYLVEKIILSVHTGLRRGSLFPLRWEQIDFLNKLIRIPRTKSGRPHSVPLSGTDLLTLQQLHSQRIPDCPFVFPHQGGRQDGQPVVSVKNGFRTARELAGIKDFTWHDLRHTFASWLMMRGASLRAVAELLGHRGLRMVMRYAHLSPLTSRRPRCGYWMPHVLRGQKKGNAPRRPRGAGRK